MRASGTERAKRVRKKIGKKKMTKLVRGELIKVDGDYWKIDPRDGIVKK